MSKSQERGYMIEKMLEYYSAANEYNCDIIYCGPIWSDGIEGIGNTLRMQMGHDELPLSLSQSVFSVFVEQMNNMLHYSSEKQYFTTFGDTHPGISKGAFILGSKNKRYFAQSGNVMKNEHVAYIKSRIDYLNTLDKDGLRKFYKEQIKGDNPHNESKGAGLGLIEIARRSNSPIEYRFEPYKDGQTFFTMFVTIG